MIMNMRSGAATTTATAIAGRASTVHLFYLLILSCFASCSSFNGVKSTTTTTISSLLRTDSLNTFHFKQVVGHYDLSNQPSAPSLYPPLTNPVTNPLENPYPPPAAIVTVPPTNPVSVGAGVGVTPNPPPPAAAAAQAQGGAIPTANPISPVTNPVTTPAGGGAQPVTNPVTTPTPTLPLTTPPTPTMIPNPNPTTNAPAAALPGQSWCVARNGLTQTSLQTALDYACGLGGADCSAIQQGGSCYNPNTLQNHASFAFNSYYQKNPVQTSCDFGGNAMVTNQNPSTGSCVYPTSSTSGTPSSMPTTTPLTMPTTTTTTTTPPSTMPTTTQPSTMPTTTPPSTMPTTTPSTMPTTVPAAGTDAPLNVLNSSTTNYPPLGGGTSTGGIIGASPPADGSYVSLSNHLQPFLGSIPLVSSITAIVLINPLG